MKKYFFFLLPLFLLAVFLFGLTPVKAQYGLDVTAGKAGYNKSETPYTITTTGVNIALALVYIIFFILVLYAGIRWMTAQGNEEHVTKAKNILEAAIIGLVVISMAYAITNFVLSKVGADKPVPETPMLGPEVPRCDTNFTCSSATFSRAYCDPAGNKLCCSASGFDACVATQSMTEATCAADSNICQASSATENTGGGAEGADCTSDTDCATSQGLVCVSKKCAAIPQTRWYLWDDGGTYSCYGTADASTAPPTYVSILNDQSSCETLKNTHNTGPNWCLTGAAGSKTCTNDPASCPPGTGFTSEICQVKANEANSQPCANGIKDGQETDVDCGGNECGKPCGLNQGCSADSDCTGQQSCVQNKCKNVVVERCCAFTDSSGAIIKGGCQTISCNILTDQNCQYKCANVPFPPGMSNVSLEDGNCSSVPGC